MGAKNSSASMQFLMKLVMRGLPIEYLMVYLDDIVIATPDEETHLVMLEKVFDALVRAGLKINPEKCVFGNSSCSSLGFFLDGDGIRADDRNLGKIREWPVPNNITTVRAFLGLCNYYRCHLPGFAKIAEPLTSLLSSNGRAAATIPSTRCLSGLWKEVLRPDASDTTVGAVLTQLDDNGKEVMVAAASQKLNEAEVKWCTYDKEMFGLIWAVRHFSHYLKFQPFEIHTDHKPLLTCIDIDPSKDGTGKCTRWALEISTYEFVIKHKSGRKHSDADSLSRAIHADLSVEDPRDKDDLIILGATSQTEVPMAEINVNEDLRRRIRDAQAVDAVISKVIQNIANPDQMDTKLREAGVHRWFRRNQGTLIIRDGLPYKNICNATYDHSQLVIPALMVDEILNRAHGDYRSGHPGAKRMFDRLQLFCVWPKMLKNIAEKVSHCHECQAYLPHSSKEVPIIPQHAAYPLHYLMTDLLKPYPPSGGFNHVLVVEDRFTQYCAFYPMRGAEAVTMAKRLEEFVTRFGFPTVWGSDNGPKFKNRLVEALCVVYNTKKEFSLMYHPQKQGQVKRKNYTLIMDLAKKCNEFGGNWSKHLPWIEFTFNSIPHRSTGMSPYCLMFGREPRIPEQNITPQVDVRGWKQNMKSYWKDTQEKLSHMHKLRDDQMAKYQQSFNLVGSKRMEPFRPGDWVLKRLPRENRHKLLLHWDGPLQIKKCLAQKEGDTEKGNVYVLTGKDGTEFDRSMFDLKPYSFPKSDSPVQASLPPVDDDDVQETKMDDFLETTTNSDVLESFLFDELFNDEEDSFPFVEGDLHSTWTDSWDSSAFFVPSGAASRHSSDDGTDRDSGGDPDNDSGDDDPPGGRGARQEPEGGGGK